MACLSQSYFTAEVARGGARSSKSNITILVSLWKCRVLVERWQYLQVIPGWVMRQYKDGQCNFDIVLHCYRQQSFNSTCLRQRQNQGALCVVLVDTDEFKHPNSHLSHSMAPNPNLTVPESILQWLNKRNGNLKDCKAMNWVHIPRFQITNTEAMRQFWIRGFIASHFQTTHLMARTHWSRHLHEA
jgi:hypothetical protein